MLNTGLKNTICSVAILLIGFSVLHAQSRVEITGRVGIGTATPKGQLDVTATNLGLVVPRVADVNAVTNGYSGLPVDGTIVYDTTREAMMFRVNGEWVSLSIDHNGNAGLDQMHSDYQYLKASLALTGNEFGVSVGISEDGNTVAIGAFNENGGSAGINGDQFYLSAAGSGAVYVFVRSNDIWAQQAYIKASNTGAGDAFGLRVTLNADGNTLVVGAPFESSNATGINGDQSNNSASASGAVYVFVRTGTTWAQQAYMKASNTGAGDLFGSSVSVNAIGNTIAVGSTDEDSNATGINGDQSNNSALSSGAAYVFVRALDGTWSQQAYIKASNTGASDVFAQSLDLNGDGNTLVIGSRYESSNATGINGDQNNNSAGSSGAAYVFVRSGTTWSQQAYIKASNTDSGDQFGNSLAVSADGNTMICGAYGESSNATGVNGDQNNNSAQTSGAAYVFIRAGTVWSQQAYIKASNTEENDFFSIGVSISADGNTIASGATGEDSKAIRTNGDQTNNAASAAGAVYLFRRSGITWSQHAYIKASNTEAFDQMGRVMSLSSDGSIIVIGASAEDSGYDGIEMPGESGEGCNACGFIQCDNSAFSAGAAYIIE